MTCVCCDRRAIVAGLDDCDCTCGAYCLNCQRCERHCFCPFDLRELRIDGQAEGQLAVDLETTIV